MFLDVTLPRRTRHGLSHSTPCILLSDQCRNITQAKEELHHQYRLHEVGIGKYQYVLKHRIYPYANVTLLPKPRTAPPLIYPFLLVVRVNFALLENFRQSKWNKGYAYSATSRNRSVLINL